MGRSRGSFRRRVAATALAIVVCVPTAAFAQDDGDVETDSTEAPDAVAAARDDKVVWRSDTFDSRNLAVGDWDVRSPAERGVVTVSGGLLTMRTPGSAAAETWKEHQSLHLSRPVPDTDAVVAVRFDALPSQPYEAHGLVFAATSTDWVRFDVIGDLEGGGHRLYAASSFEGTPFIHASEPIAVAAPFQLRIRRLDHQWTASLVGQDGATQLITSFVRPLEVAEFGPFATSRGTAGQAAILDIVVDDSQVVIPEPNDATPPLIQGPAVVDFDSAAQVTWFTDERTTGVVRRIDPAGAVEEIASQTLAHEHRVAFFEPVINAAYRFEIVAIDSSGNETTTQLDEEIYVPTPLPVIDLYGPPERTFGQHGVLDPTISISGRTTPWDRQSGAVTGWRLDGGDLTELPPPRQNSRLAGPEEFNIVLDASDIAPGGSTITIEARDTVGSTSTTDVRVEVVDGEPIASGETIDWAVDSIDDVALPISGDWRLVDGGVALDEAGPFRALVIGDDARQNYEAEFSFTLTGDPEVVADDWELPFIGAVFGWNGLNPEDDRRLQPSTGRVSFGLLGSGTPVLGVGFADEITANTGEVVIPEGVPYRVRAQVDSDGRDATIRLRVWRDGTPEPTDWVLIDTVADVPSSGGFAFVAHRWPVTFGPLTITDLDAQ